MTDPISSSGWTGPLEDQLAGPRHGVFTYRAGEPSFTSDHARLAEAQRIAGNVPPQLRAVIRLAGLLFLSPLLLLLAGFFLRAAIRDQIGQDNSGWLFAWGSTVMVLAVTQIASRSVRALFIRKLLLGLTLSATVAASIAYAYLGLESHANVVASSPERTFELTRRCGKNCVVTLHQRADGTTVEGVNVGAPLEYASSCALAQRLDGPNGFNWMRTLDRSRAPARGQLSWPIRREECFSDLPLATLPR